MLVYVVQTSKKRKETHSAMSLQKKEKTEDSSQEDDENGQEDKKKGETPVCSACNCPMDNVSITEIRFCELCFRELKTFTRRTTKASVLDFMKSNRVPKFSFLCKPCFKDGNFKAPSNPFLCPKHKNEDSDEEEEGEDAKKNTESQNMVTTN